MNLVIIHWCILSYFFLILLFLLNSNILTVISTHSAIFLDCRIGRINLGTFDAALTFLCSGISESSLLLSSFISDLLSASQSSSLSFELSKSPCQFSQFSVSEMLSGERSSSLSAAWQSICFMQRAFITWVHPPERSFGDKAGGTGDHSDNLNAATPSCWKFVHDDLMISSVSEMYPTPVICIFWVWVSICVARRFWLPCDISKMLWTFAIQCNVLGSASLFMSMSFTILVVSNAGSSLASNSIVARANCFTMTSFRGVSPLVFDCLHPITSCPKETLASSVAPWGMIENMSHTTFERSVYFECLSSCWCHQSAISGNQNVLLISIQLEW